MKISYLDLQQQFHALDQQQGLADEAEEISMDPQIAEMARQMMRAVRISSIRRAAAEPVSKVARAETECKQDADTTRADLESFFERSLESQMAKHKAKFEHLFQAEMRRRKEEEERIRQEQERIKREKEEQARKLKEEQEKLRKKQEEELKAKQLAEEKAKKEQEAALEAQRLKDEAEAKRIKEEEAKAAINSTVFHKEECIATFVRYKGEIDRIKREIKEPMAKDTVLKKQVNAHKRKMNPKFGQLTNSQTQLTRITQELHQLLLEGQQNTQVYHWLLNFIAKCIVLQAQTEVSIKPKMAVPIAKLSLNLMLLHPELKEFLMARFVKKCPMVIGYICAIDTESGRSKMGWKRTSDGKYEDVTQYAERVSGIMILFVTITTLKLDQTYLGFSQEWTNPWPLGYSWTLAARIMDSMPSLISEEHFTIMGGWWDACSGHISRAYGKQGAKLLTLVSTKWVMLGKQCASRERLKMLGEDWAKGQNKELPAMET